MLDELWAHEGEREGSAVHRAADIGQHVRHGANVVFVTVRQHERGDTPFLLQVGEIGNDPIDAQELRIGKHHSGVDNDRCLTPGECQHIHAEFTEPAERNDFEHAELFQGRKPSPHRSWRSERSERSRDSRLSQAAGCA